MFKIFVGYLSIYVSDTYLAFIFLTLNVVLVSKFIILQTFLLFCPSMSCPFVFSSICRFSFSMIVCLSVFFFAYLPIDSLLQNVKAFLYHIATFFFSIFGILTIGIMVLILDGTSEKVCMRKNTVFDLF